MKQLLQPSDLVYSPHAVKATMFLFILIVVVPQYMLIKLALFLVGLSFWFIVPVVKAMTLEERAR